MAKIDFSEYAVHAAAGVSAARQTQSSHAHALAQLIESIAGAHINVSHQTINGDLAGYASQLRAQMCTIYRLASMLGEAMVGQGA